MNRYEAVLFDVDDTLLDFDASEEAACRHVYELCGNSTIVSLAPFVTAFHCAQRIAWNQYTVGTIGREDVFCTAFEQVTVLKHLNGADPAVAARTFQDWFIGHSIPEPEALRVLTLLHGQLKTGVISNYELADVQRKRLATSGLSELLDIVVISGDKGIEKPDPAIFDDALGQLGLGPGKCLFIGDSPDSDAAGASAAGIDFCWYRRHRDGTVPQATFVITSLAELPGLLHIQSAG